MGTIVLRSRFLLLIVLPDPATYVNVLADDETQRSHIVLKGC